MENYINYMNDFYKLVLPDTEITLSYELTFYPYSSGDYNNDIEYSEVCYTLEFFYYFNDDISTREYFGIVEDLTAFDGSEFFEYVDFEDGGDGFSTYMNIPSPRIFTGYTETLNMDVYVEEQVVEFVLYSDYGRIESETIYLSEDINNQWQDFVTNIPVLVNAFQFNEYYIDNWANYYYDSLYIESYNEGYSSGYSSGYSDGEINRPLTTFGTVIKVISDNASSLLNTEILPNFTISNIIFIPVIFSLLGIVFKFFRR